jgi:glycosyltransferase involved in cell wall biosynthesis
MTRVLVLTPTIDGHDGLSALARQFTEALAAALPDARLEVLSLTEPAPGGRRGAVAVHGCGGSRASFVSRAFARAWRADRPDIVVAMHAHLLPAAAPLVWAGVRLVSVLVGVESWRRFGWLEAWTFARASRVIAISEHTGRRFRQANPGFASCAIDVCWPATPELPAPEIAAPAQPSPYALIVGRMSREERYKGHDRLLDVWPAVQSRVPGARLVVASAGDDAERLRGRARALGLDGVVRFVGPVEPARLAALYRDAAVVVLPSTHEGFGFVFLEAMASGRPCIGARGAAEEIIEDGVTGFIVDPVEADALVSALARLLTDHNLRTSMGHAGRARALSRFARVRLIADLARVVGPLARARPAGEDVEC